MPAVPFNATVQAAGTPPDPTNAEVVRVTALATDTATIIRQQEGSAARTILIGDLFYAAIMAKDLDEPNVKDAPSEDVFVPAGKTLLVGRGLKIDGNLKVDGEVTTI